MINTQALRAALAQEKQRFANLLAMRRFLRNNPVAINNPNDQDHEHVHGRDRDLLDAAGLEVTGMSILPGGS